MEDPKAGVLLRFLRSLDQTTTHLFLMGDIFDLWIADHAGFTNKFAPLIHEIANLVKKGVEVHYFEGNHDFHLKEFWQDRVGATVHEAPVLMRLGSQIFRLEHGDQTNPEDRVYRFQRWCLRTSIIEFLCFMAPGWLVNFIGETWSGRSRKKRPYVNEAVRERARRFAEEAALHQNFDLMICGHIHMKDDHRFRVQNRDVRYLNLGTWLVQPSVLEIADRHVSTIELS
jgi:UDP-2,3-diacylglucosamine hydrolase